MGAFLEYMALFFLFNVVWNMAFYGVRLMGSMFRVETVWLDFASDHRYQLEILSFFLNHTNFEIASIFVELCFDGFTFYLM